MDCQFGYNCRSYLPSLGKCRVLVDLRRQRTDLVQDKWLGARDLLIYAGCSPEDVVSQVASGLMGVRRLKNGRLLFRVSASWDWDDCPLGDAGGQCLHFQPHDGQKIACLRELESMSAEHPNIAAVPSDAVVSWTEEYFAHVRAGSPAGSF
jgi:hypothetical protein